MATTTIRLSRELHDRIADRASRRGGTLAAAIERALDVEDRAEFWAQMEATMGTPEARETARNDQAVLAGAMRDGLDPDERWDDVL